MLPQAIKSTLWSYDTNKIDVDNDHKLIISQVLNFGTKKASDWVFINYGKEKVKKIAMEMSRGQWNKKSLNFWSLVLGFDASKIRNRFE